MIDSYTKLLLHCDGVDGSGIFTDSATGKTTTPINNAQIDTAQSKFGGASGLFDGTGDYLSSPDSEDWNFGSGNFTLDFWVRFASTTGKQDFCGQYVSPAWEDQWVCTKNVTTHKLQIQSLTGGTEYCNYIMTNNWSPSANTWYHIAFVRSSTSIYIFIGGTSQSLTATTAVSTNSFVNVAGIMKVGTQDETNNVNGWIDEFRVSKGIARWTANFTPPTRAYGKGMSGAYLFF